jgi:hypothetical protein
MIEDQTNETTPDHFEIFKDECCRWIHYFGLKQTIVRFEQKDLSRDGDGDKASCCFDIEAMSATITLSINWDNEVINEKEIRRVAFHEVFEGLILGPLLVCAESRFVTPSEIRSNSHRIVRLMENTIFDKSDLLLQ